MKDLQRIFSRMPWQRRIGEIGVNLLNIHWFEKDDDVAEYVSQLLHQSSKFIAWALPDIGEEKRTRLLMLDAELARWQLNLNLSWLNANERKKICQWSKDWSDMLTELSELLCETPNIVLKVAEPKP